VATVSAGEFEWDDAKAAINLEKHGVSFEEAAFALLDPHSVDLDDPEDPTRSMSLAVNPATTVLYVVSCDGSQERTRIISARKAKPHEQHKYQQEQGH
jgi:uncharacterized DUF497 family protein